MSACSADGKLTAKLRTSDRYVVEGLDTNAANVGKARRHFKSLRLRGKVTAVWFDGRRLPYAENLVNLLVVGDECEVSDEEMLRVLAPGGVAYIREAQRWKKIVKPWPDDIDEWSHYLHDATGKQRWRTPVGGASNSIWNTDMTMLVHEGVVLCAKGKQTIGLSAADGHGLWQMPGARGFGICNPPDLFVADGLIWRGAGGAEPTSITGFDPKTGEPARTVTIGPVITHGHHARCYRSKATDNYLLLPKRATEFIDLQGDKHSRHNWVRGACRYGMLPCNGLLYSTPHPCFCYAGVKLGGFMALAGESRVESQESRRKNRLERGPAYGASVSKPSTLDSQLSWPMYRHDSKRSGSTTAAVGTRLQSSWKATLGGKLTQSVVVGDKVFVARVDAGQICCLHVDSGNPLWDFIAGSRIDSSPTYHDGRLLFGSADGWVYCLRASDGELAWRFRAAPEDRRVVAFGQVESAWPAHGSVLVLDDVAYVTAGRP